MKDGLFDFKSIQEQLIIGFNLRKLEYFTKFLDIFFLISHDIHYLLGLQPE